MSEQQQPPTTINPQASCVHTQEVERLRRVLQSLLDMQGEIHTGWNDMYYPVRWVHDVVRSALRGQTTII